MTETAMRSRAAASRRYRFRSSLVLVVALSALAGCTDNPTPHPLRVVATTTLVGDAVRTVGGDHVSVTVLLPWGVDPHSFEPSPRDVASLAGARLVFINGLGLEEFLEPLLGGAVDRTRIIDVSQDIAPRFHAQDEGHAREPDPHVWFVPRHVATWSRRIAKALAEVDPLHATTYAARADSYALVLNELDSWIRQQVELIPPEQRVLVTDHDAFGYFAERYGFDIKLSLFRNVSTLAEPSARDVAAAIETLRAENVKAIFVGFTAPQELAQRIAADAGVPVVRLYTGSLSADVGPAPTYVSFMRYNVEAIVGSLRGSS